MVLFNCFQVFWGHTRGLVWHNGSLTANQIAHEYQKRSRKLASICPLSIDELPFSKSFESIEEPEEIFDRGSLRWNLADFWDPAECLVLPPSPGGTFRTDDVKTSSGSIRTDIGWRDFRLAQQADALAAFNPIFPDRATVTNGVANELKL